LGKHEHLADAGKANKRAAADIVAGKVKRHRFSLVVHGKVRSLIRKVITLYNYLALPNCATIYT
jgi:hypothetical protein